MDDKIDKVESDTILNVLSLEDSARDFEIICEQLTGAGYNLNTSRVDNKREFESSIRTAKYDIILADFNLPGFDASTALNICNKICPDIPFICVSGSIGEEKAIEIIKQGAVDYVLKERLIKLPIAVKRALKEANEKEIRKKIEKEFVESELNYRTLADSGHAMIWTSGTDKLCNYFNQVWLEFTGHTLKEELGNGWTQSIHPDDLQHRLDIYHRSFDRREKFIIEYRLKQYNGKYKWIIEDASPRYNSKNEFIGYIGHCLDVTERVLAVNALRESEERFRMIFENSLDAFLLTELDGKIITVNPAGCNMFGQNEWEIKSVGINGIIDSNDQRFKTGMESLQETGHFSGELIGIKANGENFHIEMTSQIFTDHKKNKRISTVIRDITERKKAEEKIKKLNRLYAVLSEINKIIVRTDDKQELFEKVCRIAVEIGEFKFCRIGILNDGSDRIIQVAQSGLTEENNEYISNLSKFNLDNCELAETTMRERKYNICNNIKNKENRLPCQDIAFESGYRSSAAFPLYRFGNVYGIIIFYSSQAGFFDEEEIKLLEELCSDITYCIETLESETQKHKFEEERDLLFNYSIDMMCILGFDGYFKQLNPAWEKTLGWTNEELMAKQFIKVVHPDDCKSVIENGNKITQKKENINNSLVRILCKDGTYKWLLWNLVTLPEGDHIFAVTRDVTSFIKMESERKELETQLIQAQKLESLGTMAGGIAHDFNNILNIIMGYASILKTQDIEELDLIKSIDIILDSSKRGAALVKQLLAFAQKSESIFQAVRINDIIAELIELLRETFPKTIEIQSEIQENLPLIIGDSTQIHQVFLNLCVNAKDAMQNRGNLTISAKYLDSEAVKLVKKDIEPGDYIEIQLKDTGMGMDETVKQKIFDPFFTTKDKGKGTGLGLAIAYGIIKNHGGFIDLVSKVDGGTCFYIYLPAQVNTVEPYYETTITEGDIPRGTGTILIIEDEKVSNELLTTLFAIKGYKVIPTYDGLQGIMTYQNYRNEIKVVISDLGLPKLGGEEVYKQIKAINPKVKVILLSGFIDPEVKARLLDAGVKNFIQKPYLPDKILRTIKEVIEDK